MSWIRKFYEIGRNIDVVDVRTGERATMEIVNHVQGVGFQAQHTVGIICRREDGTFQEIEAAFLDEFGGDVHSRFLDDLESYARHITEQGAQIGLAVQSALDAEHAVTAQSYFFARVDEFGGMQNVSDRITARLKAYPQQ